jgi:hypothetical protein
MELAHDTSSPPRGFWLWFPQNVRDPTAQIRFFVIWSAPPARSSGTHKRISSRKRQGLSRLVTAAEKRCGRASHFSSRRNSPSGQKCFIIPALQHRLNGGFVRCLMKHSASIHGIALAESKLNVCADYRLASVTLSVVNKDHRIFTESKATLYA